MGEMPSHYSIAELGPDGMSRLRTMFPDAKADFMNFVMFSTSGIHGTYTTIEDIEASLAKYGENFEPDGVEPDDWFGNSLTVLVVMPRIVCMVYGNVEVSAGDIGFLKELRASSLSAMTA